MQPLGDVTWIQLTTEAARDAGQDAVKHAQGQIVLRQHMIVLFWMKLQRIIPKAFADPFWILWVRLPHLASSVGCHENTNYTGLNSPE